MKGPPSTTIVKPTVYVFTFPPTPHVYNLSPFGIKVESFLRIHQIPYEVIYTVKFSSKGTIPYIRINDPNHGEEIADSNVIIPKLKSLFQVNHDASLSNAERAVGHAMTRMLEEHTAQIGFYYRYGLHMEQLYQALDIPNRMFEADRSTKGKFTSAAWKKFQPSLTQKKTKYRGLSRHQDEELWKFSNDDLQAIEDYLQNSNKDKKLDKDELYFFGGKEATSVDAMLFGHLVQFLYIPIDFPQREYVLKHCPHLVKFVDAFRKRYWPDWEEKCNRCDHIFKGVEVDESERLHTKLSCGKSPVLTMTTAALVVVLGVAIRNFVGGRR